MKKQKQEGIKRESKGLRTVPQICDNFGRAGLIRDKAHRVATMETFLLIY